MNCNPSVEKNKEILKDLWTLDKEKYKNFDNVVKFVLEAPISDENKAVSISIMADIFVPLSEINKEIELGKNDNALTVSRNKNTLYGSPTGVIDYLDMINSTYGIKRKKVSTLESMLDKFENLLFDKRTPSFTEDDYKTKVLNPITLYFNNTVFPSDESRQKTLMTIESKVKKFINKSEMPDALESILENFFDSLKNIYKYVNIFDTEKGNDEFNTYLVTLKTLETVEAENTEGIYYDLNTGLPIDISDILNVKKALYQRDFQTPLDKVANVFYPNDFASGLRYRPFSTVETNDDIVASFGEITDPDTQIKIYAIKLNDYTDDRVSRLQQIPGLKNKNYETFETAAQSEYLKNKPNSSVVTLVRETKKDDQFTLVAEIQGITSSVNKFYIYGPTNYGILSNDNTVQRLDLTNDDHLQLLQNGSILHQNKIALNLDDLKLQQLKNFAEKFNSLKKLVNDKVEKSTTPSVDITEEFNSLYKIEKNFVLKSIETLDEARTSSPNAFHDVQVIKYNKDGSSNTYYKSIPFLFTKRSYNATGYVPVNFLAKDEYILFNDKQYFDIQDYFNDIGLTEDVLIEDILKNAEYNGVFVTKNANGEYGYRSGMFAEHMSDKVLFSKFLTDVLDIFERPSELSKIFTTFNQREYSFRVKKSRNYGNVLSIDFDFSKTGDLQIVFQPYSTNKARYQSVINNSRNDYKFVIGKDNIKSILTSFIPSMKDYDTIKSTQKFLEDIEIYTNDGELILKNVPLFINAIYTNNVIGKEPIINKVITKMNEATKSLNDLLQFKIVDVIEGQPEKYKDFLDLIKDDFGKLENVLFNTYQNGTKLPFITFGRRTREAVINDLDVSLNTYFLTNSSKNNITIATRDNSNKVKATDKVEMVNPQPSEVRVEVPVAETEIKPEKKKVKNSTKKKDIVQTAEENKAFPEAQEEVPTVSNQGEINFEEPENMFDDDVPFAVVNPADQAATKENVATEDKWFADTYAKDFSVEDLSGLQDLISLTKLEGSVLGAVKDRVIYLNDMLRTNQKGILYHESFHAVFRYLMNTEQRRELLDTVINDIKNKSRFSVSEIEKFAEDRNIELDEQKVKDLIAEEILAEGFQKYMNKKMAPKTLIQKFFEFLKNILNFFVKHSDYIDNTYDRIRTGNMQGQVATSDVYNNEIAFLSIPGLIKTQVDDQTGKVIQKYSVLSSKEQNQLVDSVVKKILDNKSVDTTKGEKSFDQMFDQATADLLNNTWNLEKLLNSAINKDMTKEEILEKQNAIKKAYGDRYKNYQFMLGGRMRSVNVSELNGTGNPAYDNKFYKHSYKYNKNEAAKDNSKGEVSYDILKDLVKKKYNTFNSLLNNDDFDQDDQNTIRTFINNGVPTQQNPANDVYDEQDAKESDNFDNKSISEYGHSLESLPKEIREILSVISYDIEDKELGIKVPRFVDGYEMYGALLKMCANIDHDRVLDYIERSGNKMIKDGIHPQEGQDLLEIHKFLKEKCGIIDNEHGERQINNSQFYNIFVDTVVKFAVDYTVLESNTRVNVKDIDEESDSDAIAELTSEMVDFKIKDKILSEDINRKKNKLISDLVIYYNNFNDKESYKKALTKLNTLCTTVVTDPNFLSEVADSTLRLDDLSNQFSEAFNAIGLKLPTSLIRLSLLGIQKVELSRSPKIDVNSEVNQDYIDNENLILSGKYLEQTFFKDIISLTESLKNKKLYTGITEYEGLLTGSMLSKYLNDNSVDARTVSIILRNAAEYLIKYDPTESPSVYRNAEGKPCYRFISATPVLHIANDVRTLGVVETLKQDPFFANQEAYFTNNPFFKDLFEGNDTELARQMKLYFKTFNPTVYGGFHQNVDGMKLDGKVFKDLDEQSLAFLYLLGFMQRSTNVAKVNDEKTAIETFTRVYTTIESTNTSYLVPAIYEKYAGKDGIIKDENGVPKAVIKLLEKVQQEYARMLDEAKTRQALLDEYNSTKYKHISSNKGKRLLNDYNAVLDDSRKNAVEDTDGLRAFSFRYLLDFFNNNKDLEKALVQSAIDGKLFNSIDSDLIDNLTFELNEYLTSKLDYQFKKLKRLGILLNDEDLSVEARGKGLFSKLLPRVYKVDNTVYKIEDEYSNGVSKNYTNLITDAYLNFFINSLFFNEIFDGDIALGISSTSSYFKRQKRNAGSGSDMKKGFHKTAIGDTILAYQHPLYLEYGPYYDIKEIDKDPKLNGLSDVKAELKSNYGKKVIVKGKSVDTMHKTFDGQSFSTIMHQMELYDKIGRLNPKVESILIAKHYRSLTQDELDYLNDNKVVMNPKKTVTASRTIYNKLSEVHIDRNDVSTLDLNDKDLNEVYDTLHNLYSKIYNLRKEHRKYLESNDFSQTILIEKQIQNLAKEIHTYYKPLPHRVKLHELLNSMEYHNVDQFMDTEASKTATVLPISLSKSKKDSSGYINLEKSAVFTPNKYKFWQVETSGIKSMIKYSVQSKVLVPANLKDIPTIMSFNSGKEVSEYNNVLEEMNDLLAEYHETLKDVAESHEALMKKTFTNAKDQTLNVGLMFDLIRKSLSEQEGVSANKLKLFETDPATGQPIHNPNLPEIKSMLTFYFFSQYSKFTDEKGVGDKYIHVSSYGFDVMVDEKNNVITTDEYKSDPAKYQNIKSRPLAVSVERINGKNVYWVECILPLSAKHNPKLIQKYKDKVLKMFATRIPTEDKRSMVALKVVDFIDSSYVNGIIVPQVVHILSGSDLDIDTLYTQQYSFYKDFKKNNILYGDYSSFKSEEEGKFFEYVMYMGKDKDFSSIIKSKTEQIKNSSSILDDKNVEKLLEISGLKRHQKFDLQKAFIAYKDNTLFKDFDVDKVISKIEDIEERLKDFEDLESDSDYELIAQSDLGKSTFADLEEFQKLINQKEQEIISSDENASPSERANVLQLQEDLKQLNAMKKAYFIYLSQMKYMSAYVKSLATLQTLADFKLPHTQRKFNSDPIYAKLTKNAFQNKHLDTKLNILTNEHVYKNLYINEKSSVQMFYDILDDFGINLKQESENINPFTIDGVIDARIKNTLAKLGVGIAANMNKTLAFLSQYTDPNNEEGNIKDPVWKFRKNALENINIYNKLASFTEDDVRTIAIIGCILGMFTDAAKDPIPAALDLNLINAPITLTMLSLGVDSKFALAINFISEIKNAILKVEKNQNGVKDGLIHTRSYLTSELNNAMKNINGNNIKNSPLQELKDKGLVNKKSSIYDIKIISDNLIINYAPVKLDAEKRKNNELSLSDVGITIKSIETIDILAPNGEMVKGRNEVELSEDAQKLILLTMYKEQSKQTSEITSAGNIVNMFKKINPKFKSFDKLKQDVNDLKSGNSIITDSVVSNIFGENQVWNVIDRLIQDIDKNSKMFLERSDVFEPIKNSFEYLFKDKDLFGTTVSTYVGIHAYKNFYLKNLLTDPKFNSLSESVKLDKVEEKYLIDLMSKADYWFTNELDIELLDMQQKYPDNELLKRLECFKTKNIVFDEDENEYQEKFLRLISGVKIQGRLIKDIEDDANELYVKEPRFFKKLFIHEVIRTGLKTKEGSFLQYLNTDFKLPISKYLDNFQDMLTNISNDSENKMQHFMEFLNTDDEQEVYEFMRDMFANMIYASSDEQDNKFNVRTFKSRDISLDGDASIIKKVDFSQLENPAHDVVEELFDHIFPIRDTYEIIVDSISLLDNNYGNPNDNIIFNFSIPDKSYGNLSKYNMIDIASAFNVGYNNKVDQFVFPPVLKFEDNSKDGQDVYYILQGTDDKMLDPVGKNIIESEKVGDDGLSYSLGQKALYKRLPLKLTKSTVNPVSLNLKELQRYERLVNGKDNMDSPMLDITDSTVSPMYLADKVSKNIDALNTNIEYANIETLVNLHNNGKLIFTLRVSEADERNGKFANNSLGEFRNFGNIFTGSNVQGLIQMGPNLNAIPDSKEHYENDEAAADAYDEWLDGKDIFVDSFGKSHDVSKFAKKRAWILAQIEVLKKQAPVRLGYFKTGYKSHANILNNRINGTLKLERENLKPVKTYKGKIIDLTSKQVFVFGSNPLGINGDPIKHPGMSASVATANGWVEQGEKLDNTISKAGKAYGLTTVTHPGGKLSLTADDIMNNIHKLYEHAKAHPEKEFLVAYAGPSSNINNNGYTNGQMAKMFSAFEVPDNVIFNDKFAGYMLGTPMIDYVSTFYKAEAKPVVSKPTPMFNTLPSKNLTPSMTYAGIGSRQTPTEVQDVMTEIAAYLKEKFVLRSGKAAGADIAFEKGAGPQKEIFPGNKPAGEKEHIIAREIHANPEAIDSIKDDAKRALVWNLMARNTNQIFGKDLDTPVDFVVCWTPLTREGKVVTHANDRVYYRKDDPNNTGGTGQAIAMASLKGIPVINLADPNVLQNWKSVIDSVVNSIENRNDFSFTEEQQLEHDRQVLINKIYEQEQIMESLKTNSVELIIFNNLPKLLPESARKESGVKTGNTKDIPTSMLSKNGVTVDEAVHDIWENNFGIDSNIDTQIIKDIVIDILQTGPVKFKSQVDGSEELNFLKSELKDLEYSIKELKNKNKVVKPKAEKVSKESLFYKTFKEKQESPKETQTQLDLFSNVDEQQVEKEADNFSFDMSNDPEAGVVDEKTKAMIEARLAKIREKNKKRDLPEDPEIPETGNC